MLIEPVPISPRGRGSHLRTVTAVALPAVVLVAVVATSVLAGSGTSDGGDSDPVTAARASAGAVEAGGGAPALASPHPDASTPTAAQAPGAPAAPAPAIPRRSLGLPALSVAAALSARRADGSDDRLVAIRGYLTVAPFVESCVEDDAQVAGPPTPWLCKRLTILRDAAAPAFSVAGGVTQWIAPGDEPYLHLVVFPGVSLGPLDEIAALDPAVDAAERWLTPRPVIVIGRFDDPRVADRRSNARHVNETFVIERLVWADGRWQDRRLARVPPWRASDLDLRTARAIAAEALAGGTVILSQNVVEAATLAELAPDASAAVRSMVDAADRLWYVRAMTRSAPPVDTLADDGGPRRLGWAVIAADGTILAVRPDG